MANTNFRIQQAWVAGTPAEPPFDAWPLVEAPPVVVYPEQAAANGQGYPCPTYGRPRCLMGRNIIGTVGLAYWAALFPSATAGSVLVKANLYDTRSQTWGVWQGVLWRPTVRPEARGGTRFNGFRVLLSELTAASWS